MTLRRWRTTPNPFVGWIVRDEQGELAEDPNIFPLDDHDGAQRRADELNRADQYAIIGVPDPTRRSQ